MTCFAADCPGGVSETAVFCDTHRKMLTPATFRAIERTYRPGQLPSKRFLWALSQAQREIAYFVQHGSRMPVDVSLGFDATAR